LASTPNLKLYPLAVSVNAALAFVSINACSSPSIFKPSSYTGVGIVFSSFISYNYLLF
jgi:hypothetical protein